MIRTIIRLHTNFIFSVPVYGPKEFEKENLFVQITGQSKGLKLLLNVNQQESCGYQGERPGAGFSVFVHDVQSETSFETQSSISLSPGFQYNIALQPIQYDLRNYSEWLGKCTSSEYNFLKPNSSYNQQSCFTSCFLLMVSRTCHCLPLQPHGFTAEVLRYTGTSKKCSLLDFTDFICTTELYRKFYSANFYDMCPECKRKCLETKYDYKISSKKLSLPSVRKLIAETVHTNESVLKNFILVSFHFETMSMITIKETQSVTLLNLFIYWSNIWCLFLGFTVITVPELLYYIFTTIQVLMKLPMKNDLKQNSRGKGKITNTKLLSRDLYPKMEMLVVAREQVNVTFASKVNHDRKMMKLKDKNHEKRDNTIKPSHNEYIIPGQLH